MIIEFAVKNFRSIYDTQVLRFVPKEDILDYQDNIYSFEGDLKLLNVICIYGANASGKSNILRGFLEMRNFLLNSNKLNSNDALPNYKFKLFKENSEPTTFQIKFLFNSTQFVYGYSFKENIIVSEWLHKVIGEKKEKLFERSFDDIDINEESAEFQNQSNRLDVYVESTNPNTLFLAKLDSNGLEIGKNLFSYFSQIYTFNIKSSGFFPKENTNNSEEYLPPSAMYNEEIKLINPNNKKLIYTQKRLNNFLQEFKLNINKIYTSKDSEGGFERIKVRHNLSDKNGQKLKDFTDSDFLEMESNGTVRLSRIAIPIMFSTITGSPLIIDEIEDKLHPLLVNYLIYYFMNPKTNPLKAQLIFTTHNTNILSYSKLRRDQIWLTEKNKLSATELYSLADIKINKNSNEESVFGNNIERNYLEGKFGAIPF